MHIRASECAKQPQDHDNNHHNIQDRLDFFVHGEVGINEPQRNTDNDENEEQREDRHNLSSFF
jgi:hypothetical protein